MKLVATYPSWRKPVSETYIVDAEDVEYWVDRLIATGAITVQTRDQSACRLDIPPDLGAPNYFYTYRRVVLTF